MQQRQPRLGDILDDYCPRERRVTNHAVVAMIGAEIKQTRCTTCEVEHVFKHAKVPRQRRKSTTPAALYSQVLAGGPKRVTREDPDEQEDGAGAQTPPDGGTDVDTPDRSDPVLAAVAVDPHQTPAQETPVEPDADLDEAEHDVEQGPAHRRLIRATLPRQEGQPPPTRPAPEFTIRQPNSRQGRFRPRHQRGPSTFHTGEPGNRSGNSGGGGGPRQSNGRPPLMSRSGPRHGPGGAGGRKQSK